MNDTKRQMLKECMEPSARERPNKMNLFSNLKY